MRLKIVVLLLSSLFFWGCANRGYYLPSQKSEADIINSRQKAYVVFATDSSVGASRLEPIFEYHPDSQTFSLVAVMGANQRYIYPIDEGVHYFYSMGGETYDFIKVVAKKGRKYYVDIDTTFWTFRMTTPIFFVPVKDKEKAKEMDQRQLIENTKKSQIYLEKRKDREDFKVAVRKRFEEWKEEDMKEKTLEVKDGFEF